MKIFKPLLNNLKSSTRFLRAHYKGSAKSKGTKTQEHLNKTASDARAPSAILGGGQAIKKIILLSAIVTLAFYLIITHTVPAGLSENAPAIALSLNSDSPAAAVAFAQQAILDEMNRRVAEAAAKDKAAESARHPPVNLRSLEGLLRAAIAKDPLNARAFRLLGQIALLKSDAQTARRMMAEAARLSIGETVAIDFMMRQSLLANNAKEALRYADILMRANTKMFGSVAPIVARMSEIPSAKPELIARLADDPPWRRYVLNAFPASGIANLEAPFEVLSALKETPHPPSETEVAGYINFLLAKKRHAFAYSVWLQFLSQERMGEVAYLFNGSFERRPSGLPFDWIIDQGFEIVAGIFARPDDDTQSALFVSFGQARSQFPSIRQTLVLRPGAYRFRGSLTGEILARRGLQWRVTCEGTRLGESQVLIGRFPQWSTFEFDILVPPEKCPVQTIELLHMARSQSEQLASGALWFDDFAITRRPITPVTGPK